MKKIIFALTFLSFFGLFAEKPVVAVLEIENKTSGKSGLSSDEIELIAELMRSELIQTNEFNVMRKDEMETAIAQHIKKSHQPNRDSKYAIELGKTISARYIIISKILKDGKKFRISAEMIDTERGSSPHSGNAKFTLDDDDSKDIAIASLIKQLLGEREESFRPKKSEVQIECEKARADGSVEAWEIFLRFYSDSNSECVLEARKKLEEIAYQNAMNIDTLESWQEYLEKYPSNNKSHIIEANKRINKLKKANVVQQNQNVNYGNPQSQISVAQEITAEKIGDFYWSEVASTKMNYNEAQNYCRRLKEGGISGWRLPTIDELRTLVQNCPGTMTGGVCKISAEHGCLASYCLSSSCQCGSNNSGKYSVFGDRVYLWSSSQSGERVYVIDFSRAGISSQYSGNKQNVRCIK